MPPAGRFKRFMNLERPRSPSEPAEPPVTKARFEPQAEIPLAADFGEQPFIRCPSCEADNNRMAERCFNCQQPLLTPEARAWNAEFWQKRAESEKQQPAVAPPPVSEENRRLAEALAAVAGQRERSRLWWMDSDDRGFADSTPMGLRLLQLIGEGKRTTVAMAMVVSFLLAGAIALWATSFPRLRIGAGVVAMLLFLMFLPNTRRRRRGWWGFFDD